MLKDKNVVVMGAGKSGIAATELILEKNGTVILYDENKELDVEAVASKLEHKGAKILCGEFPEELLAKTDYLVMSPGIPVDTEFVEKFRKRNIPVWGEIELAYTYAKGKLLAITGTNGKTTTTALVGHILEDFYGKSFVVGNIGNPYTTAALQMEDDAVTVAEVSSFQLETIHAFHPKVSAILNITPDHLNRHHTMENYTACKFAITRNQTKEDVCVLNYEDEITRGLGDKCTASVLYFSSKQVLEEGYYYKDNTIYEALDGNHRPLLDIREMKLLGIHNVENVMAAIAMTAAFDVPMESILSSVKSFQAVEHRIEYVRTVDGVDYYNDSKGTNPDAAIKGIQAMNRRTVLIGGGYDKDSTYDEWIENFDGKVSWLVLLGQTKEKIAACAKAHGFENIIMVESLEEALLVCREKAKPGEAVLLSPACASWGMFPNYEVRGNLFKELVHHMEASNS